MSYNTEITALNLTDMNEVSSAAPNEGEVLTYTGASWAGAEMAGDDIAFSFRATGSWQYNGGSSDYQYQVDTEDANRPPRDLMQVAYSPTLAAGYIASGLTQYNWGLYESWYSATYPRFSGVFVPAGTWLCRSTFGGRALSSSGHAVVQWFTGGAVNVKPTIATMNPTGPKFRIAQSEGRFAQIPTTIITTTNTTTLLGLQVLAATNFQFGYVTSWVKYFSFHVTKLA
jgi:hypothetical protein